MRRQLFPSPRSSVPVRSAFSCSSATAFVEGSPFSSSWSNTAFFGRSSACKIARFWAYRHEGRYLEEPSDRPDTSAWRAGCTDGLEGHIRLAEAAFVGLEDGSGDGEGLRVILARVGVGEAGLATAFAVRCFGVRGAGDKIATKTRGS